MNVLLFAEFYIYLHPNQTINSISVRSGLLKKYAKYKSNFIRQAVETLLNKRT